MMKSKTPSAPPMASAEFVGHLAQGQTGSICEPNLPIIKHQNIIDIILQFSFSNGYDWYSDLDNNAHEIARKKNLDNVIQAIVSYLQQHHGLRPSYQDSLSKLIKLYYSNEPINLTDFPEADQNDLAKVLDSLHERVREQFAICSLQQPNQRDISTYLKPICKNVSPHPEYYSIKINNNITLDCNNTNNRINKVTITWEQGDTQAKQAAKDCIRWYFATHQLHDILEAYQMGYSIPVTSNSTVFQNAAIKEAKKIITAYRSSTKPQHISLFRRYQKHDDPNYNEICSIHYPRTNTNFFQPNVASAPPLSSTNNDLPQAHPVNGPTFTSE